MRHAFLLVVAVALAARAEAQRYVCGPGGCYQVSNAAVSYPLPDGWQPSVDPDVLCLIKGGQYVGAWSKSKRQYHVVTAGNLGPAGALPAEAPEPEAGAAGQSHKGSVPADQCKCGPDCPCCEAGKVGALADDIDPKLNFGIDLGKMRGNKDGPKYSVNGREVTRSKALDVLAGAGAMGIPDDEKLPRLSCIGTEAECAKLEQDLKDSPALATVKQGFVFQSYRPNDPMVKDIGLAPGHPSIYYQKPEGKVLARWESYPGPEKLAEAIRKRDPNYDPNKDPQPDKQPNGPDAPPSPAMQLPTWVLVLLAAVVFLGRK